MRLTRRHFSQLSLSFPFILTTTSSKAMATNQITTDGVFFSWHHRQNRLFGNLRAPTKGWIAVGFNDMPKLEGTYFVIAHVQQDRMNVAEHIAQPPRHTNVRQLGRLPQIDDLQGTYHSGHPKDRELGRELGQKLGISWLSFSLPHHFPNGQVPTLSPGHNTHLMLAWSHEADFNHHSAWRRHFDITL